jgi:hypothetical protein
MGEAIVIDIQKKQVDSLVQLAETSTGAVRLFLGPNTVVQICNPASVVVKQGPAEGGFIALLGSLETGENSYHHAQQVLVTVNPGFGCRIIYGQLTMAVGPLTAGFGNTVIEIYQIE